MQDVIFSAKNGQISPTLAGEPILSQQRTAMSNRLTQIAVLLVAFLLGGWLMYRYLKPSNRPVENATVLLEKIRPVLKLTTVEGQYSEIYNYSEYQGYFTFFWDKKALVRVRATVSAGYDLNNLHIEADSLTRTLRIGPLPEPQILSIDHTLDYYDVSEGIFADFSPEDYNRINQKAKDLIRDEALKSGLLDAARTQAGQMLDLVRFMAESAGWKVESSGGSPLTQ